MDLQIKVFKNGMEEKPSFRATVQDFPLDFDFSCLIKASKSVFGDGCCVEFFIV